MREDRYVSRKEYRRQQQPIRSGKSGHKGISPILWIVVAVVIACLGFFAYRHFKGGTTNPTSKNYGTVHGNPGTSPAPSVQQLEHSVGTVTSFSATSITILPSGGGNSETFTITSSTLMQSKERSESGAQATAYNVNELHDGEVVTVLTSSGSSKAVGVLLFAQSSPAPTTGGMSSSHN